MHSAMVARGLSRVHRVSYRSDAPCALQINRGGLVSCMYLLSYPKQFSDTEIGLPIVCSIAVLPNWFLQAKLPQSTTHALFQERTSAVVLARQMLYSVGIAKQYERCFSSLRSISFIKNDPVPAL